MGKRRITGRGPIAAVYACRKSRREKEQSQPGQSGPKTEKRGARAGRAHRTYISIVPVGAPCSMHAARRPEPLGRRRQGRAGAGEAFCVETSSIFRYAAPTIFAAVCRDRPTAVVMGSSRHGRVPAPAATPSPHPA